MRALFPPFIVPDVDELLVTKLKVTLTEDQFEEVNHFLTNFDWLTTLINTMQEVKIHTRMVWFKTVCGAWTTSHRLHEDLQLQCLFGCQDCKDTICHYLYCLVIWQIAREVCPNEDSSALAYRLGLDSPSMQSLNRLAIVFGIYHSIKNDLPNSFIYNSMVNQPTLIQSRAVGFAKSIAARLSIRDVG